MGCRVGLPRLPGHSFRGQGVKLIDNARAELNRLWTVRFAVVGLLIEAAWNSVSLLAHFGTKPIAPRSMARITSVLRSDADTTTTGSAG